MARPERAVDPRDAAVTIAVTAGARTLGQVVEATGLGRDTVYRALRRCVSAGLVSWPTETKATLNSRLGVAASSWRRGGGR